MSFTSEYLKLRKKKLEEEENKTDKLAKEEKSNSWADEYLKLRNKETKDEEKDDRTWFSAGAFDDGYQAGDVTRTVLGTAADVVGNAGAGALELIEGVTDTIMYGVGGVGSLFGANEFADDVKGFIKQDLLPADKISQDLSDAINPSAWYDTAKGIITGEEVGEGLTEKSSVLGEKTDSLAQSAGQLAGQIGLQAVGVPWWLTSGVSGFGGEVEQAFNEDATYLQAGISGAISAGAEILTEKISGGIKFGGRTLDEGLTQAIGKGISNKIVKTLLKFGVDATGEGLEEVVSQAASSFGQWLTYKNEEDLGKMLFSEEAMDAYLESFIGGAFLGGVSSGVNTVKNVKKGADPVTGLTQNEQKVVDQVYEKRVAEKENQGEKLTNKDKNKLYDETVEDMQNGNIDISDIEEALGGDSYKAYKSESDNSQKLKAEYDELANMEKGKMTHIQEKRLAELDKMDFNDKSKIDGLKKTLSDEVFNTVKGDRKGQGSILMESYVENAKTHQAFQADYSQYKGTKYESAAKQTIDNAMKAGANDTRKVHNIVDMAAKLSSETGVVYEFGSNETIKQDFIKLQSEKIAKLEALENPTTAQTKALSEMKDVLQKVQNGSVKVNGNITGKGVMLNLDSHKALNRVVGHELTHTLEKTAHYEKLQSALFEYAKAKGVKVDEKIRELESLYAGVEGDAKAELTADLVGDYLFNDYDFVKRLSTDKNLFQKVWDEIKYIAKMAKPGSKEARALAKVERMFEKAFQESKVEAKANNSDGTQHSLSSMANTFFDDPNMSANEFVQKDYKQTQGYKDYVEQCLNNYRQTRVDFDEAAARKAIEDSIDGIVRVAVAAKNAGYDIYDDPNKVNKRDSKNRLLFSSLEPNSDYFTSSDISTICDKRKNFAEIYDEIVRQEEAKGVPRGKRFFDNVDNYFALHKIMADKGLTQPCRQCYVESMRKNLAPMANAFLKLVKETNPDNKANEQLYQQGGAKKGELKSGNASIRELVLNAFELHPEYGMTANDLTVETLTTEDGLAQLKIQAPLIYEAFNSFYGQSKPKMPKSATPFRFGELTALLTDEHGKIKQSLVNKINATGGFRLQSYSDFQIQNYTDVLQVIFEAGTLGLKGHAYTKVPAFLDATEGTNLKRNISIFMYNDGGEWKIDKNDSFPYALDEIYDIVNADESGNTSIIAVSQNAEMSAWIMANDNVGYGIPFHKSGMKMGTVRDTDVKTDDGRVVKGYSGIKDHTKQQSEVWASTTPDHKALTKVKAGVNIYEIWDFDNVYGLSKNELIEKNVKAYIDECARRGYLPKFREYVMNNDKVLNDVLKYTIELGYAPSNATIDDISFTYKGYTIPYGYYKFLGDFGMFSPDGSVSAPQTLSLENYDFDKAVKFFADAESLRRNEILQQFSNGEERQKYRDSDLNAGELNEIVKQKRSEVADEVINRNNKSADTFHSLSRSDDIAPIGRNDVFGKDFRVQDDIAPVVENTEGVNENVDAPMENVDENVENVDTPAETVEEKISKKLENFKTELANNEKLREKANADFDAEISRLQAEYDSKKKKNTKAANDLLRRIERVQRMKSNVDADYDNRITSLQERIEKLGTPEYQRAEQRKSKQQAYTEEVSEMIGDTSTWQDKKMGLSYQTNTLHRNLRDVVRDAQGNRDIAKADEIYEYLQGAYNHHEAQLKLESRDIKKPLAELKLNKYESKYAQMLGEFKYNPDSKLSKDTVDEYYNKHKNKIDTKRVDKAIEYTRETYDALIKRVNEVLREQGMKEIPYRQGYFPHFMDEKQGFLAKLFNWKTQNNDIPTDIAGLTETFEPNRSWQSFNKQRTSDTTDYNLLRGFDTYVHGALDWIYHIEDIQKRRALENEIRYRHSEQGIKDKIDKIKKSTEYDADEAQELMDAVYKEARNPLNNFVTDLRNGTNNLAGKKSSEDRNMEYMTNRKIYSTMTNLSNRVTANMVAGSVSSALTNFIPITQSWGQVSPISSLKATKDMIKNAIRSDGMIEKSDFMTNRLIQEENLNQTGWDKAGKVVGSMMEIADRISTEVVWRSKYMENLKNGMSENEAIHNADIFAENVMAGRSRGNAPTIFNAKNPAAKMFTAFQLEVANQYGYMFKDMPQDIGKENIGKLVKGYAGVFVGAYVYNAIYSALTGRDAAFSPLDIIQDLLRDLGLGDDEEEEVDVLGAVQGLAENVAQEVPFVGGLFGGGRIPISSALPYELSLEGFNNFTTDVNGMLNEEDNEKYTKSFFKEMMKPVWYVGLPMGGGQIKKTTEGLSMFSEDIGPVAGSYTDSGNLRFPVEDTPWNRIQAGIFGQYSSANAREYFDEDYAPLSPNQTQEFADVGMSFTDYHKYRDGLKGLKTLAEKFDYIDSLDLTVEQKNILINNIVDRDEPVDMTGYGNYGHYEEFDFATKNPEKYSFFKSNNISYESYVESEESKEAYNWAYNNPEKYQVSKAIGDVITYRQYSKDLSNLQADKDKNGNSISGSRKKKVVAYINSLNADYGAKIILYKMQYESDDRYNKEIVEYLNGRDDISYMQMVIILRELGMNVDANGKVTWN